MSEDNKSLSLLQIPISNLYSSLFSGVLLSYWDNIMGPRVQRLWQGNEKVEITPDLISFVSSHTLNGELCRIREEGETDTKFYVLTDHGYFFFASVFLGMSKSGQTVFSLSFIMALQDLDRYLELQQFLNNQIAMLVMKFRVLQEKDLTKSVAEFTMHLERLVIATEQLRENDLPFHHMSVKETLFWDRTEAGVEKLNDTKFLMRAITSHLQTCGCTLVIGVRRDLVNLVVNTLALFLTPTERACSRYASGSGDCGFERDLFIQGLVRKSSDDILSSKDVILNNLPTTFIDIDTKEVKQTSEIHVHYATKAEFLKLELQQLLEGKQTPVFPTKGLFHEYQDIAIMVQSFVFEIILLSNLSSVREKYIANFLRLLNQKSATLISYVEAKSLRGVDSLSQADVLKMRHDLSLISEADFRIVLAQAEKRKNGMVSFLFRDQSQYQATNQGNDMIPGTYFR